MSYVMETELDLLAQMLPDEYLKQQAVEYGETFEPDEEVPDVPIEVEYEPGWFQSGCRSGHPDNWTPDEGEDPEVVKVTIAGTPHEITSFLTREQIRDLAGLCWEDQQQQERYDEPEYEPDDEPYYDYHY